MQVGTCQTKPAKMKRLSSFLLLALAVLSLSSCFKDEEPNAECDILKAWVHVDDVADVFFQKSDTVVNVLYSASNIEFSVRRKADLTNLAPLFDITPGATITPANGSAHDFSQGPVTYTVTSESGEWSRKYQVGFKPITVIKRDTITFEFENFAINEANNEKYYRWYETELDGSTLEYWASANAGFAIAKGSAAADEYPTVPAEGYNGWGVKLITRSTGAFGQMVKRRLAAGNFFIGEFDPLPALTETLKCTLMGRPFVGKPVTLSGFYKYKAGEQMQDKNGKFIDGKDQAAIYAVFYLNHDAEGNEVMLYGDDCKTNKHIVAMADMTTIPETDDWTYFEIPFEFRSPIDPELIENRGYSLTVVFSSSKNGETYEGAIGSTLCIDNVKVACETEE